MQLKDEVGIWLHFDIFLSLRFGVQIIPLYILYFINFIVIDSTGHFEDTRSVN
jgi:hypothetical protein